MRIKTAWSTLGKILLIVVVTALFVYPFWWMVVNSLNTAAQVFGKPTLLPVSWRWENYKEIFQIQPFGRHLFNSNDRKRYYLRIERLCLCPHPVPGQRSSLYPAADSSYDAD